MNKFEFLGRLTKEVETRATQGGTTVAIFNIAVNRRYNNEQVKADFFQITAFGKTAEFCSKYFQKGQQVLIEGRIQNRSWDDQNGQKRYATDYIAEQVYFADSSRDGNKNDVSQVASDDFMTIDDTDELPF